jgi:hypothetical protein
VPETSHAVSVVRKIIVTALVGGASFLLTDLVFSSPQAQFAMAVGFGSVVLLIQFLIDFEKRIRSVERQLVDSVSHIRDTVDGGFARINDTTQLITQVEKAGLDPSSATTFLHNFARIERATPLLVREFAALEIDRVSGFLHQTANLQAHYDGEDQEWLLGLTRCARESIDAISLPEIDAAGNTFYNFWLSSLGRRYLHLQREAIEERDVKIRRAFLAERDYVANNPTFRQICDMQAGAGIEVRLLYPSALPRTAPEPMYGFILFDNVVSYETTPAAQVKRGEIPLIRETSLRMSVDDRITLYKKVWPLAIPWPT